MKRKEASFYCDFSGVFDEFGEFLHVGAVAEEQVRAERAEDLDVAVDLECCKIMELISRYGL